MTNETKINIVVLIVVVLATVVFVSFQMKDSLASVLDQFDDRCSIDKVENCSVKEARKLVQEMVDELNLKTDKTYYILEQ